MATSTHPGTMVVVGTDGKQYRLVPFADPAPAPAPAAPRKRGRPPKASAAPKPAPVVAAPTAAKSTGCTAVNGTCGRKVYAKQLCMTHYRWSLLGKPTDRPIRSWSANAEEQLVPPRVSKELRQAIQSVCLQGGISEYEFARRLYEDWYEAYRKALAGAGPAAKPDHYVPRLLPRGASGT